MTNGYSHVRNLPSYVKDTTEFINQIETTQLSTNCKLASVDVSSLYINIPHEGVQSALHFLKTNPEGYINTENNPIQTSLGELMSLVLKQCVQI